MEYPFIKSLVPETEHFDSTAVGEGVWMSVAHFNATENKGTQLTADVLKLTDEAISAIAELNEANANNAILETAAIANATTIATQAGRITALEAQVAEYGKQSSGTGTNIAIKEDAVIENKEVPSYASDSNPANEWIDKRLKAKVA